MNQQVRPRISFLLLLQLESTCIHFCMQQNYPIRIYFLSFNEVGCNVAVHSNIHCLLPSLCLVNNNLFEQDMKRALKQVERSYSTNRRSANPLQLYITDMGPKVKEILYGPGFNKPSVWDVCIIQHCLKRELNDAYSIITRNYYWFLKGPSSWWKLYGYLWQERYCVLNSRYLTILCPRKWIVINPCSVFLYIWKKKKIEVTFSHGFIFLLGLCHTRLTKCARYVRWK